MTRNHPGAIWSHLIRTKDMPVTQEITRVSGVLCQEPGQRPGHIPCDLTPVARTAFPLGAWEVLLGGGGRFAPALSFLPSQPGSALWQQPQVAGGLQSRNPLRWSLLCSKAPGIALGWRLAPSAQSPETQGHPWHREHHYLPLVGAGGATCPCLCPPRAKMGARRRYFLSDSTYDVLCQQLHSRLLESRPVPRWPPGPSIPRVGWSYKPAAGSCPGNDQVMMLVESHRVLGSGLSRVRVRIWGNGLVWGPWLLRTTCPG